MREALRKCLKMEVPVLKGEDLALKTEASNLTIQDNQVKPVVQQERVFDWDSSNNENISLAENGSKSGLSCDDSVERVDIGMEVKKKDDLNDQVQIGGRVLSSVSEGADKISDDQEALNLTVENKDAEPTVQQECDLDWDRSKGGNVGCVDDRSKMSSLSCDDSIRGVDTEVEVMKKAYLDDTMQISGRVLRSASKRAVSKIPEGEITENEEMKPNQQPRDLDLDVSKSGIVGLTKTSIKRNTLRPGHCFEGLDIEMELKKKSNANDEVKTSGRVLRSMSKRIDSKIFHGGEADEMLAGKNGENEHVWFEKNKVEAEKEEGDYFVSSSYEKKRVDVKMDGNERRKLKRKRGRPPKLKMEEQDQSVSNMQGKCGSPPKLKMEEQDQLVGTLQRKRGRPPKMKMEEQDQSVGNMQQKRGRPPKVKMEEQDRLVGNLHRKRGRPPKVKMEEQDQLVGNMQRKRGRPPKVKMEEQDQLVGNMQRKRGRPFKVKMEEQDQLPGKKKSSKRGRPPKSRQKINHLEVTRNRKRKKGFRKGKKGITVRDGTNMNAVDDMCLKVGSCVEESKKKILTSPLTSNSANPLIKKKKGSNKEKQLVRQHILQLLLAAGWVVDYRPRNGKEYNDAVYVSPDGKTHWSITLAYKRLQKHCEAGDGEGEVYIPGFKFVPISFEEFNILTKVIKKKRKGKDKLKQTGGKDGGINMSLKGKVKRKIAIVEEYNLDKTSLKKFPALAKDRKRQKTHNKKRSVFMVRNAEEMDSETNGYILYTGKRTVLAWMIDLGTVLQNERVHYVNQRRASAKLEGRITRDGIHCDCCNEIVTMSEFEAHAGSELSNPLKNIHIGKGTSLLQCLLDSWNKQDELERKGFHFIDTTSEDPNDEACGVCGDGGDLICCDNCPSTFHQSCLNIKEFPPGNWHCIYCCCKFCELVDGNTNERDGYDDFTTSALLTCHLCDQKYHRSCVEVNGVQVDDSSFAFYCGNKCEELSKRLEMLLGVKHDIEDGLSWTFVRRSDLGCDASQIESQMVECNSKLAVALSVMDECFMPYIDNRSGINLIHSILYNCGSNFNRLNYSGFITAILERGDEVIGAASIRIRGNQLAEMPFIGTRYMYRRQGMCRRLLSAIESALSSLNVELLVIPAVSEVKDTWTSVFGFEPLEVTRKKMIKNFNLLVFPHVDMLMKEIKKPKVADEDLVPIEVLNPKLQKNQSTLEEATDCDEPSSFRSDLIISASVNDRDVVVESGSSDETVRPDICPKDVKCEVGCQSVSDNLTVEGMTALKADNYDSAAHLQAEAIINHDCVQSHPTGSKEINSESINGCGSQQKPSGYCTYDEASLETTKADKSDVRMAKATNLHSLVHSGDCQRLQIASGSREDIPNGANEKSEAASTADGNSVLSDKAGINRSSELPEVDLQVNQTGQGDAPSLCGGSSTGSGMALHCASAGGTSCGNSTEVVVLSNEAG
ncbi:hypothetical protein QN277_012701 [Acacia crassicarpa]|uniref:PHD-type domain-containing protein n=2 Tax=Acacia crassicarpa TaxID=499986 RepID=A0AAE1TDB0_9FABA|nr:hypothetical protein QN277_012701 [Acacia crassicarpa]